MHRSAGSPPAGAAAPLDLTLVPTSRPGPRPAVLVLPGGGYEVHADHEGDTIARWLAGLGAHAFVLRYAVAPQRYPAALRDAEAALAHIRGGVTGADIDTSRVGVIGFSAGGHLAADLSNQPHPPDFAILGYPVISFVERPEEGSVAALLGPDATPEQRALHSVDDAVTAATPPTFLWHTAEDDLVPVTHSLAYARRLAGAAVPFELHVFPRGGHGLGLAESVPLVQGWPSLCARWLEASGFLDPVA